MGLTWLKHLDRALFLRFALPVLIGLAMLGTVLVDLADGHTPLVALLALGPGVVLGYPFGRLTKVGWNPEKSQVALIGSQLLVFAAYLSVRLWSRFVVAEEFRGVTFAADLIRLLSIGSMAGYSWGLSRRIRTVLQAQGRQRSGSVDGG